MKIVIVGGVAGGATTATRLRRLSETDEIVIIERDEYISYANCGLPYYIGGVIKDKSKLQINTVEGLKQRYNLDVRVQNEVLEIDKINKKLKTKKLATNEIYEEHYDKLILSCGAKPIKPNIKGLSEAKNIFTLRNIHDTYRIKDFVTINPVKKAVVVGGGFIGVEMAENLAELGIAVTLVEKMPQVLRQLDFEMAQMVHKELNVHGVELVLGDGVSAFSDNGKNVILESGKELETDITILAIGVVPENTLAKTCDLKLGARGHLVVTDTFNTRDNASGKAEKDIYAIGDMIEVVNPIDDSSYAVPLAWGANRQGRLLADHLNGIKIKPSKIMGASVLKVFDMTVASTGANEEMLKQMGIEYTAIHAHRQNHASYYPNSSSIALKMLFDKKSGRIYGAQAVGREMTEKRIDVISTVMRLNGTARDLSDLELCYAPPYSSSKDPVNILGYIAESVMDDVYQVAYHHEIDDLVKNGGLLIDVRSEFEFGTGHIDGAVNIDIDLFRDKVKTLDIAKDKPIFVCCQIGLKAYQVVKILIAHGYTNVRNLSGGLTTYKNFKYKPNAIKVGLGAQNKAESGAVNRADIETKNKTANELEHKTQNETENSAMINETILKDEFKEIDCCGMQCPGPLMATYKNLETMKVGELLKVVATDNGFSADIISWCETNGHTLKDIQARDGKYYATIEKGGERDMAEVVANQKNATIVVFSGDLDKVLASMIIAQGAAAQGKDVTMFFTFWGLNALRKPRKVKVKKTLIEKMFGAMMPRGADKLPLSNMNMAGMGSKMIKGIMKKKNVDALPVMIKKAQEVGVKMIACTMSMDLMGIKAEELIDNIDYAGVATYISKNENVGTTLFI